MSYEVLARKWRPQSFADVVGQQHVVTTLQNQISTGRVGHAYLFWGPRGTGKTTIARVLAKAVNCTTNEEINNPEPCNRCVNCQEISSGRSFDVREMDAASNRGIDTIRELKENAQLVPASCRFKIYIIDEAHMLSLEAFNALLKTLEEPPAHVIFILATTEHHKVPPAIVSRCQGFDFRFMEQELVTQRLKEICKTESIEISEEGLALISHQSEGCLRDATNILERLTASIGRNLSVEAINQILGLGAAQLIENLSQKILEGDVASSIQQLANLSKVGADLIQCLQQLIAYFSDLRRLAIDTKLADLIQASPTDVQRMINQTSQNQVSAKRLSRILRILIQTYSEIKKNGYAHLLFESALVEICATNHGIQSLSEVTHLLNELKAIERRLDSANTVPIKVDLADNKINEGENVETGFKTIENQVVEIDKKKDEDPESQASAIDDDFTSTLEDIDLDAIWRKTLIDLQNQRLSAYQLLKDAMLTPPDSNTLGHAIKPGIFTFQVALVKPVLLLADKDKELTAKLLSLHLGRTVELKFVRQQNLVVKSSRSSTKGSRSSNVSRRTNSVKKEMTADEDNSSEHLVTETPRRRQQQDRTPLMLQREVLQDETLSPVLSMFDAKILKIQPK